MRDYIDKIVFWACIIFIGFGAFAGGVITAFGVIYCIWRCVA